MISCYGCPLHMHLRMAKSTRLPRANHVSTEWFAPDNFRSLKVQFSKNIVSISNKLNVRVKQFCCFVSFVNYHCVNRIYMSVTWSRVSLFLFHIFMVFSCSPTQNNCFFANYSPVHICKNYPPLYCPNLKSIENVFL